MKAVVSHEYGDVDQLRYEDAELPPIADNEVRVRCRYSSRLQALPARNARKIDK